MKIKTAKCEIYKAGTRIRDFTHKLLLPGEIKGITTYCAELREEATCKYKPGKDTLRVFIFTGGSGDIMQGDLSFQVHEPALFVPLPEQEFSLSSGNKNLGYLEIVMNLTADDLHYLDGQKGKLPYYLLYSDCRKYNESIKSEKAISRMILPEDIVPRLCIGSVETTGPDEVSAHSHPMLEQLFFSLPGNDAIVTADSTETRFIENELLHIPLGSRHGTRVKSGKYLHYIWIDLFHSQQDMDYITNTHIMKDE